MRQKQREQVASLDFILKLECHDLIDKHHDDIKFQFLNIIQDLAAEILKLKQDNIKFQKQIQRLENYLVT